MHIVNFFFLGDGLCICEWQPYVYGKSTFIIVFLWSLGCLWHIFVFVWMTVIQRRCVSLGWVKDDSKLLVWWWCHQMFPKHKCVTLQLLTSGSTCPAVNRRCKRGQSGLAMLQLCRGNTCTVLCTQPYNQWLWSRLHLWHLCVQLSVISLKIPWGSEPAASCPFSKGKIQNKDMITGFLNCSTNDFPLNWVHQNFMPFDNWQ